MNRYYLEITVKATGLTPTQVDDLFDPLADAVYELTDVIDADLGARLNHAEFDVTMAIDADNELTALSQGIAAVRCAIHAAGGATPGWEEHFETIRQEIRREPAAA